MFVIGCCFQAISVCVGSPLFVGSPWQNIRAPWGEPFTLLRSTGIDRAARAALKYEEVEGADPNLEAP